MTRQRNLCEEITQHNKMCKNYKIGGSEKCRMHTKLKQGLSRVTVNTLTVVLLLTVVATGVYGTSSSILRGNTTKTPEQIKNQLENLCAVFMATMQYWYNRM